MSYRINRWIAIAGIALAVASLSGCNNDSRNRSGGSGDPVGGDDADPGTPAFTGVFVDSAISGIGYRTSPSNHSGTTNSAGEYQYDEGDSVVFFIGGLEFPSTAARGIVTPLHIAGTDDVSNQVVVNIARLLQSLDQDGDPSNGITIPTGAASAATAASFDVDVAQFAASSAIVNLVANSGSVTTSLVSESAATLHLQDSIDTQRRSLIGSWYYRDDSDADPNRQYHIVLTFLDDTRFVIANDESESDDVNGQDGVERGTYSWNLRTGQVELQVDVDTNLEWGFSHPCGDEKFTLEIRGDELLVGAEGEVGESCDEAGDEASRIALQRVASDDNPLIGSWFIGDEELALVTFLEGNGYMMVEFGEAREGGTPGLERGTYVYNTDNNEIAFTTIRDTNGEWGFSHPCGVLNVPGNTLACGPDGRDIVQTLSIDGDTLTFISEADTIANDGEEDPAILDRVRASE